MLLKKEGKILRNLNSRNKQIKIAEEGKIKSLSLSEVLYMKFAGYKDSRNGLIKQSSPERWDSVRLKSERDAVEEFAAKQFALLKIEEEEDCKKIANLFDGLLTLKRQLINADKKLQSQLNKESDLTLRFAGEESVPDEIVKARRMREKDKRLQKYYDEVESWRNQIFSNIDQIFSVLANINENFDSTCRLTEITKEHCQRKVDVYWRAALKFNKELPPVIDMLFENKTLENEREYYSNFVSKAEVLRQQMKSKIEKYEQEGKNNYEKE